MSASGTKSRDSKPSGPHKGIVLGIGPQPQRVIMGYDGPFVAPPFQWHVAAPVVTTSLLSRVPGISIRNSSHNEHMYNVKEHPFFRDYAALTVSPCSVRPCKPASIPPSRIDSHDFWTIHKTRPSLALCILLRCLGR
jgi:hypothetical protein